MNVCNICSKEFHTTKKYRKTCGKECGKLWRARTKRQIVDNSLECTKCNKTKPVSEFYKNNNSPGYRYYCKQCDNALIYERQVERKKKFVEYKGGKCIRCGYNRYIGALDFHHRDPNEKEFEINTNYTLERMMIELDKCDLICANCHREEHGNYFP